MGDIVLLVVQLKSFTHLQFNKIGGEKSSIKLTSEIAFLTRIICPHYFVLLSLM